MAVRAHGRKSVSTFKPVQFFGNLATLLEVEIDTGKTHQIRVHAAHAGHPVAGDVKYGNRIFNDIFKDYGLKRMFLHSSSLGFTRPGTREPMLASAQDERGKTLKPEGARGPIVAPRLQRPAPVVQTGKPRMGNPRAGGAKPGKPGLVKESGPVRGEGRRKARTTGGR